MKEREREITCGHVSVWRDRRGGGRESDPSTLKKKVKKCVGKSKSSHFFSERREKKFELLFFSSRVCFPTTFAQHDRFGNEIEFRFRPRSRPSASNTAIPSLRTRSLHFPAFESTAFCADFYSRVVVTLPKFTLPRICDWCEWVFFFRERSNLGGNKKWNSKSTVPLADAHKARISPSANCTVRLFGCPLTLNNRSMIESTSSVFACAISGS